MILPTKHTNLSESILGLAGYLLTFLKSKPYNVDDLWTELERGRKDGILLYANHTFDNLVYAIDLLFLIGVVSMQEDGTLILKK